MELRSPFFIHSNLQCGLRVGDGVITMDYGDGDADGRVTYDFTIEIPGYEYNSRNELRAGCCEGSIQNGFSALLSFLSACAESISYTRRTGHEGENLYLFPHYLHDWIDANSDEFMMQMLEMDECNDKFILE